MSASAFQAFAGDAVFSDESCHYRIPREPVSGDTVRIRIRTLKDNADEVWLLTSPSNIKMEKAQSVGNFDYYEAKLEVGQDTVYYSFLLRFRGTSYLYSRQGVLADGTEIPERDHFRIVPGFSTPEWSHGAVMYQIYTDRFYNGDPANDVLDDEYVYLGHHAKKVRDWNEPPSPSLDVYNFYGGDLEGVRRKLDYLQALGIEVIYLNPIFVSPSNHKYDAQDYDHVDPHIGRIVKDEGDVLAEDDMVNAHAGKYISRTTSPENLAASDAFFAELCAAVHARGMRIILDGVFNHCGSFNKWLDREKIYEEQEGYEAGAYESADSPYRSFFLFHDENGWPDNDSYDSWWGNDTLPKLNYEDSPQLVDYVLRVAKKWASPPYSIDGWRLDVAADLGKSLEFNHHFWRLFRDAVKSANPDAVILAEHYGDCREWLRGDQWDTVMNYDAFMEPLTWFLTGMEKHSDEFRPDLLGNGGAFQAAMNYHMTSFLGPSLLCAMNQLDNHDHSRFLTRTNHKVGRVNQLGSEAAGEDVRVEVLRAATVVQMTFPGAPTLYYGDEVGVVGFTDPDNRRTYPWGHEDEQLLDFYRDVIRMHKTLPVLREGSFIFLGCGDNYISYARFDEEEQVVVAVNSSDRALTVSLPVWRAGLSRTQNVQMEEVLSTDADGYSTERWLRLVTGGMLPLELKPNEAVVLRPARLPEFGLTDWQKEELYDAVTRSRRSYREILSFVRGN